MMAAEDGLTGLLKRGGVYYGIPGSVPRDAITALIRAVKLPADIEQRRLLEAVLEREALMPTALGRGIALPHPRNPLITGISEQFVALGFFKQPVDWQALDGEPVHTALLIVSASAKLHLHTLSRVNFFCQQPEFRAMLASRAPEGEIIRFIAEAEAAWGEA